MNSTASAPRSDRSQPQTASRRDIRRCVARFQSPIMRESLVQVATSLGGFLAVCAGMYLAAGISYWIVLALMPLAVGFLVRTFIVQHDCGHGAFFRSKRWNDVLGVVCSLVTLAPYPSWRRQHAGHHGVWNNLDRRDTGADIYSSCLTVEEFRQLGPWARRWYRVSRNPIVANLLIPPLVFLVLYRLPFDMPVGWRRQRRAVYLTDLALVVLFCGLGLALGFGRVIEIQLPVMAMAAIVGVGLFTVQHRSEWTVWARQKDWDAVTASLEGSTYLRLPRILQWFTGNIGLHHIHHLNPRVPNYRLEDCHQALTEFQKVPELTLGGAFKAMFFVLWDERRQRMVTFRSESLNRLLRNPG